MQRHVSKIDVTQYSILAVTDPQTKIGCLIATSKNDDDNNGGGARGDKVDDDGDDGEGTERCNNQIEATAAAGGSWLQGRAEARCALCVARMPGEDKRLIIFKQT